MSTIIKELETLRQDYVNASKSHKEHFLLTQRQDIAAEAFYLMLDIVVRDLDIVIKKHKVSP